MHILDEAAEAAFPQQTHAAVVLLLDISSSMRGEKIRRLNEGLRQFLDEVAADPLASKRVDLAVVTFGGEVETMHHSHRSPLMNLVP